MGVGREVFRFPFLVSPWATHRTLSRKPWQGTDTPPLYPLPTQVYHSAFKTGWIRVATSPGQAHPLRRAPVSESPLVPDPVYEEFTQLASRRYLRL